MTPIEKIKFSFPCKEDTTKMTPCSPGLHCASCDKTVIDFRKSDLTDLTKSLEENGTICGLFSRSQVLQTAGSNSFRHFLASAIITIGLGTSGKDLIAQNQTIDSLTHQNNIEDETDVLVGTIVETMPVFKDGGDEGLAEFLRKNLQYPGDSVEGPVYVGFTIDTTGKTTEIKILRGLSEAADKEVLRVAELLEFIPGTMLGRKVAVRYNLPVSFRLRNDKKKKK